MPSIKLASFVAGALCVLYTITGADASPPSPSQLDYWKREFAWNPTGRNTYNVLFDAVDPASPSKRLVSSCQTPMNDGFLYKILDSDNVFIPAEAAYIWMPTISIPFKDRRFVDKYRRQFLNICNSTPKSQGYLSYGAAGSDYTGTNP